MLIINVKPNKCNDVTTPIVLKWVYFNLPNRSFHGCFTAAASPRLLPDLVQRVLCITFYYLINAIFLIMLSSWVQSA